MTFSQGSSGWEVLAERYRDRLAIGFRQWWLGTAPARHPNGTVGVMGGDDDDSEWNTDELAPAARRRPLRSRRADDLIVRTRDALATATSSLYLLRRHIAPDAQTPAVEKHLDRIEGQLSVLTQLVTDLA